MQIDFQWSKKGYIINQKAGHLWKSADSLENKKTKQFKTTPNMHRNTWQMPKGYMNSHVRLSEGVWWLNCIYEQEFDTLDCLYLERI